MTSLYEYLSELVDDEIADLESGPDSYLYFMGIKRVPKDFDYDRLVEDVQDQRDDMISSLEFEIEDVVEKSNLDLDESDIINLLNHRIYGDKLRVRAKRGQKHALEKLSRELYQTYKDTVHDIVGTTYYRLLKRRAKR